MPDFPRKGAWAKLADGTVGIINSISGTTAEFHVTDAKGETVSVIGRYNANKQLVDGVPLEFLTQAPLAAIPKSRRPATKEHAARLGYK